MQIDIINFNEGKYVWAKDLHRVLDLNEANYSPNVLSWFSKEYLFLGKYDFQKPVENYDYIHESKFIPNVNSGHISNIFLNNFQSYLATSETETVENRKRGKFAENYLIRLEFAKLITLESRSKLKRQFVQWLLSLEEQVEKNQLVSRNTLLGLMEMVKMCSYIDNQLEYYKQHKQKYFENKSEDDSWNEFDKFRNSILQIMTEAEIDDTFLSKRGYWPPTKLTKIEKIAVVDTLQSVRNSLFDFLTQRFSSYTYSNISKARDLANFVKTMFEAAGIERIEMKSRGVNTIGQLSLFHKIEDIDISIIAQTIKDLQR